LRKNKINIVILSILSAALFIGIYLFLKATTSTSVDIIISIKSTRNTETQIQYRGGSDSTIKISRHTLYASQFYKDLRFPIENPREAKEVHLFLSDSSNTIFINHIVFISCRSSDRDTLLHWQPGKNNATELFANYSNMLLFSENDRYIELKTIGPFPLVSLNFKETLEKLQVENQSVTEAKLFLSSFLFAFFIFLTIWKAPFQNLKMKYELYVSKYQLLVYAFFIFILFSFLNSQFHFLKDMPNSENRALSTKPSFEAKLLYDMPDLYNNYVEEHYSLRNFFFFANSLIHAKILAESALPEKVIMGKKGWFFYNEASSISDFRRLSIIEPHEITLNVLYSRLIWMQKRNIKYYIITPPNKERIYHNLMPNAYFKVDNYGHNRLDFFKRMITEQTKAHFVDPTEALQQAKNKKDVYYSTDTHWNLYGGFIGYQTLMAEIIKDFPMLKPAVEEDFHIGERFISEGDLSSMIALQDIYRRKEYSFTFKDSSRTLKPAKPGEIIASFNNTTIDSSHLKLVMFRDSYANYLIPFLNLNFEKAVYVWNYEFMSDIIEREKPDVVIFESLERFLSYALTIPNPPAVDGELEP
jgi:SGNH hydrolase-like domain, acetyltransferase AlgX